MQVIDSFVVLRLSLLLGYIISISSPFSKFIGFFLNPGIFGMLIAPIIKIIGFIFNEALVPFQMLGDLFSFISRFFVDIITPILSMIFQLIQLKLSIVKLILLPPSMGLIKLFYLLYESLLYGYSYFLYVFKFFKSFLGPLNNPRNRETTLSFLQICQQIGF